jgi:outer membrane receptor protein involved in Fe transport
VAAHYFREQNSNSVSLLSYHSREEFRSRFSAVSGDRNSERLTVRQTVPSEAVGAAALWNRRSARWRSIVGADLFRVEGFSTDSIVPAGKRIGGGTLLQHGVFAQMDLSAGPAKLFLGARHHFTGQNRRFFSPSGGVVAGRGRLRFRASVYRSFRAPTLNELFREFRIGNRVTQANDALRPERLVGAEVGVDLAGESTRASVTLFRNSLQDLIANVTLSAMPSLILRQRQNAASAVARGVEFHARHRRGNWHGELAYLFADSRFSTGARIPQVARHQGSAQLTYQRGGTLASVGLRSYDFQFEDVRNESLLPGFASVQLVFRQRLTHNLSALAVIENVLDREYLVGFTPTPRIGSPRLWRAGLRWQGRLR